MVIFGIDPGSRHCGYGVIQTRQDGSLQILSHGVISVEKEPLFSKRLGLIQTRLTNLLAQFQPQAVVIEKIFLAKNVDSAFKLGHARGVCVAAAVHANCSIFEYEARVIKKGLTGSGSADKEQVKRMVEAVLEFRSDQKIDATDALALAVHHARMNETRRRFETLKIDPPSDLGQPL